MLTLGSEFKVSPSLFGTAPLVRTNSDHSLFFSKQIPSGTGRVLYKRSAGGTSSSGKEIVRAEKGPHDLPLGYSQKHVAAHGCMVWRGPSCVSTVMYLSNNLLHVLYSSFQMPFGRYEESRLQPHFQDKKTAISQLLYGKNRLVVHARGECSEIAFNKKATEQFKRK